MLIKGLKFFNKTNTSYSFNLASYHDPKSITWSWVLSFNWFREGENRLWPLFYTAPIGQSRWALRIPFVGILCWSSQKKMLHACSSNNH